MALGGDGYAMFIDYNIVHEALVTDTDYLGTYISKVFKGVIPENYRTEEGRINIIEKNTFIKLISKFFIILNFFFILIYILV